VNAVVIARQQDKNKDKVFASVRSRQLYCHSSRAMYVLATKKRKSSQKGLEIFKARKLRNARQILDLARPEKIWPRSQKPKKIKKAGTKYKQEGTKFESDAVVFIKRSQ